MTAMYKHADGVTETLNAISGDFNRLRWLSFASSFLGHFLSAELRHAGFISVYAMSGLACYPAAQRRMNERTARAWFDGMESIQETLHGMENKQMSSVSNFALAGMVSAFVTGIGVLLTTLCMVIAGCPGWVSVFVFLVAASTYATGSIYLEKKLRRQGEDVADRLRSACRRLPTCLWKDIQTETQTERKPTVQD